MTSFFTGIVAGLAIAMPPGAIATLILQTGLQRGFRPAFAAGLGCATVDFLYASVAMAIDTNNGNVLNFVPRDPGYTGGAWNLQIVHWNTPATRELSSDTDIFAARNRGEVTIEVTVIVVRCPFVNFANVR